MKSRILKAVGCYCVTILVYGCASPGQNIVNLPTSDLADSMSRVVVGRSDDFLYMALSARVFVNGREIGSLSRGDVTYTDIAPGQLLVSVDTATSPGTYKISGKAEPGTTYDFLVSPRGSSFMPVVGFGLVGALADSSVNENSGLFQLSLKSTTSKSKALLQQEQNLSSPTTLNQTNNSLDNGIRQNKPSSGSVNSNYNESETIEEKLKHLKKLKESGLINSTDYEAQKKKILSRM
jgi:hypothetical protein